MCMTNCVVLKNLLLQNVLAIILSYRSFFFLFDLKKNPIYLYNANMTSLPPYMNTIFPSLLPGDLVT